MIWRSLEKKNPRYLRYWENGIIWSPIELSTCLSVGIFMRPEWFITTLSVMSGILVQWRCNSWSPLRLLERRRILYCLPKKIIHKFSSVTHVSFASTVLIINHWNSRIYLWWQRWENDTIDFIHTVSEEVDSKTKEWVPINKWKINLHKGKDIKLTQPPPQKVNRLKNFNLN